MNSRGITLVELIIVIAIIAILVIALGFSYQGWQGGYKVERATKELYSDLMNARSMALQRNRNYFVDFPTATSYRVSADTAVVGNFVLDGDGLLDANATVVATFPKTIEYTLSSDAGEPITFDKRGLLSSPSLPSVSAEVAVCLSTTANSDYDCINISQTRINMGKLTTNGGACNATNCVSK